MEAILEEVQAVLAATPARWLSLTETLPSTLLTRQPAPQEWSALECLQHLLDTEQYVFPVRVRAFLSGQEVLAAFDPDTQGSSAAARTPTELAAAFAERRAESLALLSTVTPADLAHRSRHSELGEVALGEMLHEWAAHDLMHTVQAERSLMQPFIVRSGAWRSYFQDHDVSS